MAVPFIDLQRQLRPIREAVLQDWQTCLDETQFVGGAFVTKLEDEMRRALDVSYVVTCANGTDAISIALQAMGVEPGTKVAIPNVTFWATYEAAVNVGCVPVLVDIDPDDLQMSFDGFVAAHDRASVRGGDPAAPLRMVLRPTRRLPRVLPRAGDRPARGRRAGVRCRGRRPFRLRRRDGVRRSPSIQPRSSAGRSMAVAIATDDEADREPGALLCNHGRATHYSYSHVGWNSRMGGLQAAFLSRMLSMPTTSSSHGGTPYGAVPRCASQSDSATRSPSMAHLLGSPRTAISSS